MKGLTHMAGGACAAAVLMAVLYPGESPAHISEGIALGIAGGLFPDIDQPNSKISHKLKLPGKVVSTFFSHRGLFHSPALYLLLGYGLTALFPGIPQFAVFAFVIGTLSHIFLDSLNPTGVPLFLPISSKKIHLMRVRTGTAGDSAAGALCWVGLGAVLANYMGWIVP